MNSHNITNESLALALMLVVVAILISHKEKLALEKDIFWSVGRAIIQLIIVGYVLKYIFSVDDASLTLLMVLFICFNAAWNAQKRSKYIAKAFISSFIAITVGAGITLAVLILRKPGAALYVNLIGTLVETVIGSQFDLGFVIISALLQGVFAEIPFALTRYRMFNLPISIASGALVALEYGTYLMLFRYVGVSFVSPRGIVHMISEVTGGVLISGVMAWYLMLAIAKTGVLDRLASGRALIERRA